MTRRLRGLVALAGLAGVVLVLFIGMWRYGGPKGLWRRAHAEVSARLPHPVLVPTPLPVTVAAPPPILAPAGATPTPSIVPASPSPAPQAAIQPASPAPSRTASPLPARPASPTVTPSHSPSPTPSPTPTPNPSPVPSATPLPPRLQLSGLTHMWQTWNNCGPATLAMNLSFFGLRDSQAEVASALRPHEDDKNVNPEELAAFARARGLKAIVRVNGDAERLRALLGAGVPVLIETWYEPTPDDGMGHYRLLVGYDEAAREWLAYDSYDSRGVSKGASYAGIRLPYDEVARLWAVFGRAYVVIYDEARAGAVEAILGGDLDDGEMWRRARERAVADVQASEGDPFAWFNLGSAMTAQGDYAQAAEIFDRARRIGLPWRMLWYQFAPFEAYYETRRHGEVIALADATIAIAKHIEELFYWRGMAQSALGDRDAARTSWERALALNPGHAEAAAALAALGSPTPAAP